MLMALKNLNLCGIVIYSCELQTMHENAKLFWLQG